MTISRRRFIAISAAALSAAGQSQARPMYQWKGIALGAQASIVLSHPEAERITNAARAEIARLEDIFSLYRENSALNRLNTTGSLNAPPFELLDCLSIASVAHLVTDGLFDPTIQPLWALYANRHSTGDAPATREIAAAMAQCGWGRVRYDAAAVRLEDGMALTLNGIAQGYIADRVAALLLAEGLDDVLIDTGELRALGGNPKGGDWQVTLDSPARPVVNLRSRALASSAPLGTVFDAAGRTSHILHPRTGRPAKPIWQLVSISAQSAAMADALSTAMCLMPPEDIMNCISTVSGARIVQLSAAT
jgi:FAD:protein FMN transferase